MVFADLRIYSHDRKWLRGPREEPFNHVGQMLMRYTLQLAALQLTLPNYSHLYLMVRIEENDTKQTQYEFTQTSGPHEFYKKVFVTITNPPKDKGNIDELLNRLIPDAFKWTGDLENLDKEILERAQTQIIEEGSEIKIPLRISENKKYRAQVLISPRGPFSYSGTAFIHLTNKETQLVTVKELFKYCFDEYAFAFLKRLQIMSKTIRVISRANWHRDLPHLPKEVELSIEKIFDPNSQNVFITDMAECYKVLMLGYLPGGDYMIEPHELEELHEKW